MISLLPTGSGPVRQHLPTPLLVAGALLLSLPGTLAADQPSPEQEQAALKRAKVLRIIGIPGISRSLEGTLKELGAQLSEQEVTIVLAEDTLFPAGQIALRPEAFAQLEKVAVVLREYPARPVRKAYPLAPVLIDAPAHAGGAEAATTETAALRRRGGFKFFTALTQRSEPIAAKSYQPLATDYFLGAREVCNAENAAGAKQARHETRMGGQENSQVPDEALLQFRFAHEHGAILRQGCEGLSAFFLHASRLEHAELHQDERGHGHDHQCRDQP